jgi:hypothetical protein
VDVNSNSDRKLKNNLANFLYCRNYSGQLYVNILMAWFFVILLSAGDGKLLIFHMFENGGKSGADDDQWCQLKNLYLLKKNLQKTG